MALPSWLLKVPMITTMIIVMMTMVMLMIMTTMMMVKIASEVFSTYWSLFPVPVMWLWTLAAFRSTVVSAMMFRRTYTIVRVCLSCTTGRGYTLLRILLHLTSQHLFFFTTSASQAGVFNIRSQTHKNVVYEVPLGNDKTLPQCTCQDFQKTECPCKHFCSVFKHPPEWGFTKLPAIYIGNPFITLDTGILPFPNYSTPDPTGRNTDSGQDTIWIWISGQFSWWRRWQGCNWWRWNHQETRHRQWARWYHWREVW